MNVLILGCKDYPAFTTPWVHSGGMEVYAERMVRSLSDRAKFTILAAGGRSDDAAAVVPLGAARGLRTQPVTLMLRSWRHVARSAAGFDVINAQTPLAGLVARMARRRFGIPYVVTVHIFGADAAHAGSLLNARVYSRIEKLVFSDAASIIPTGRRLGAALEERYAEIGSKICAVTAAGEGVRHASPAAATRDRLGIAADAQVLLFLGRIVEENGIENLLDAFGTIRAKRPNAILIVAGTGDHDGRVRNRIRSAGMDEAVRMIGAVRGQEKYDLLAAADVMVRTSRHEVFPEAYLEALSVGTPVAATPAGDTPDMAEDSQAVVLLPFGDPRGQAEILGGLLDDRPRRERMRAAALDYAGRFQWSQQKDLYWRLLTSAAEGRA